MENKIIQFGRLLIPIVGRHCHTPAEEREQKQRID